MPFYDYRCEKCGTVIGDVYLTLDEREDKMLRWCPHCKGPTDQEQVWTGSSVDDWGQGKYFEHLGPQGETFYSRKSFKEHLRRHGLREKNSYVD